MSARGSAAVRRPLLGLGFVVVVGVLVAVSVGAYLKVFTPTVWVSVRADRSGLELERGADVKVRGVVVGRVAGVSSSGSGAVLRVGLDTGSVSGVPSNVVARFVPKTLFGEKFVDLVVNGSPSSRAISGGAVVSQDRSVRGVELERVLDDLLPVLRAVGPEKLSVTLDAVSRAVAGRGDRLGGTLVGLDRYLGVVNGQLPVLRSDLEKLAGVLGTYSGAWSDLVEVLRNVTVTAGTVSDQREQLASFFGEATGLADSGSGFLLRHEGRLVQLGRVSRPVLGVLAEYAPEYPCVTAGMVRLQRNIEGAFDTGRLHITLEITKDSGKYVSGDQPQYGADTGPNCRGLPDPPRPNPSTPIIDGYQYGASHPGGVLSDGGSVPAGSNAAGQGGGTGSDPTMGYAGTSEERAMINPLVAAATGRNVTQLGDITDLLWGPLMRGTVVNAS